MGNPGGPTANWFLWLEETVIVTPAHPGAPAVDCPTPEEPKPMKIQALRLSFVPDCDPNVNLWRVTNPNAFSVKTDLFGDVQQGTTEVPLNDGQSPITLKWGGGDSGIKPGSVKASAGNDLSTAKFQYSWNGTDTFTVKVTNEGCSTGESLNVSSYTLDKSEQNNSTRFGDKYTYPQTLFSHAEDIVLPPRTQKLSTGTEFTRTVKVPDCGDYQADLYSGKKLERVHKRGHDIPGKSKFLAGGIVLQKECAKLNAAPFVTQAQCVVDDNDNYTGEVNRGSVELGQLPKGISGAAVFFSVDGQPGDEVSDLDALDAGDYIVVAAAKSNYRILAHNGWFVAEDGTATFAFTIDELDCTPVVPDEPLIESTEWVFESTDCLSQEVTETRMTTTTTYAVKNNEVVIDEVVTVEDTQTRSMTEEELDEYCPIPEQPGDLQVVGSWVVGEFDCDDTTVVQTRTVTTTPFELEGREWVAGADIVAEQVETRALTEEELAELDCTPDIEIQLPDLGIVDAFVTSTPVTCDGTYTLRSPLGGVKWFVNVVERAAGTYTAITGSTVNIRVETLPGSGIEDQPTSWTLTFPAPTAVCASNLPTLNLGDGDRSELQVTGASGMLGTVGILALLITLTGIGVVASRRRVEV